MASYIFLPQSMQMPTQSTAHAVPGLPAMPPLSALSPYAAYPSMFGNGGLQYQQMLLNHAQREVIASSLKRGADEMLGDRTSISSDFMDELSNKKVKLDDASDSTGNPTVGVPSRVIHVRGVHSDVSESELLQMVLPFGAVSKVIILAGKKQAFIEMADLSQAMNVINYYQAVPAFLRGKPVFLQYSSTYRELRSDHNNGLVPSASPDLSPVGDSDAKTVLHVIVDNMTYPVTVDVLKEIFSRYGQVLKIITFHKNNQFQALVQYSDTISAQTARASLDGHNIYNNSCNLRIDFSKLSTLNVKFNNDKSRDYTNPALPTGDKAPSAGEKVSDGSFSHIPSVSQGATRMSPFGQVSLPGSVSLPGTVSLAGGRLGQALSYLQPAAHPSAHLPPGFMPYPAAYGGFPTLNLQGYPGMNLSALLSRGIPQQPAMTPNFIASHLASMAQLPPCLPQAGCVLLVSNLDEQKATADAIFTLFGVYGDVLRVKILFNKKDNALLQYAESSQAQLAVTYLDKVILWGREIRVAPSKHPIVQMPTDAKTENCKLTKDFTNSPLHRYKKKGSKNYQNIFAPSQTLHLSNIPPDVTAELLKSEFSKYGTVEAFKFFEKDRKMALIQMGSVEQSLESLIGMHNFQLAETCHLRVSFTKSTINGVPNQ